MDKKQLVRFMSKVKVNKKTDCWEWQAGTTDGYGMFSIKGVNDRTHRLMYIHVMGKIAKGKYLYHTCHNRACCNPEHLFIGSKQDIYQNRLINE